MNTTKQLTVLAHDPSFTAWGYAVVRNGRVINAGCIKTDPEAKKRRIREGDDRVRRIKEINDALLALIKDHDVNMMVSELPHGSQNAKAAIMMGIVAGIVQTIGDCLGVAVDWFSEADAKKALLGRKASTKDEVISAVKDQYSDVPWRNTKYIDEAIADAMAVYHVACINSPLIKFANG